MTEGFFWNLFISKCAFQCLRDSNHQTRVVVRKIIRKTTCKSLSMRVFPREHAKLYTLILGITQYLTYNNWHTVWDLAIYHLTILHGVLIESQTVRFLNAITYYTSWMRLQHYYLTTLLTSRSLSILNNFQDSGERICK